MGAVITADVCKFCNEVIHENEWNIQGEDIVHNHCLIRKNLAVKKIRMLEKQFQRADKQLKLF